MSGASRIVRPDPDRRIDLPGVGPVPRPLEVGRDVSGLRDVSLRTYLFRAGNVIDGEAEGDEVIVLLLRGRVSVEMHVGSAVPPEGAAHAWSEVERGDPFDDPPEAFYLPPHHAYRLTVLADAAIAYARAPAEGRRDPRRLERGGTPAAPTLGPDGASEHLLCRSWTVRAGDDLTGDASDETILHVTLRGEDPMARLDVAGPGGHDVHTVRDGDAVAVRAGSSFTATAPAAGDLHLTAFSATPAGGAG